MQINLVEVDISDAAEIAFLHKSNLPGTRMTSFSVKELTHMYEMIINSKKYRFIVAKNISLEIIGVLIISDEKINFPILNFINKKIFYAYIRSFLLNFYTWFHEIRVDIYVNKFFKSNLTISAIFIDKTHRRQRVAFKLLHNFFSESKNSNSTICVRTSTKNTPARNLYESFGFLQVDEFNDTAIFLRDPKISL
jgi:ribosomal protein S18 acetylase RimI-like enzyme